MNLLLLVFKSIVTRKTHLITTVVMMALATAGLFVSALISGGLNNGLKVGLQRLGADVILLPAEVGTNIGETIFTGVPMNIYMSSTVLQRVQHATGIERFTPQFFTQTLNEDCCSLVNAYRLVGFDPASDFVIQPWLQAHLGRSLQENEIITGAQVESFVGDKAVILDEPFDVAGRLEPTGTSIDETIFLPLQTARRLAGNSPYLQGLWQQRGTTPADQLSAVLIKVQPGVLPEQVVRDLVDIPFASPVAASQINRQAKQQITLVNNLMISGNLLLWAICLVAIVSYFLRHTLQKKSEMGILRALGATRFDVIKIVIAEAVSLCLAGSVAGIALGELLWRLGQAKILGSSALPYLSAGPAVHLQWGLVALGAGIGIGGLASLYPAYFCASLDPARAITSGEME